jgi:hypothetical protein
VHDRAGANADIVAEDGALEHDRGGGEITVPADLASGQNTKRRHQGLLSNADWKGGSAGASDRPDDRAREHDRVLANPDRRTTTLDDSAVIDIGASADLHVADEPGGRGDPRGRMHAGRLTVPRDQHLCPPQVVLGLSFPSASAVLGLRDRQIWR